MFCIFIIIIHKYGVLQIKHFLDDCFIPGVILNLETPAVPAKVFYIVTIIGCVIVEIDKKYKFHNILALEYMMKNRKYSNTEYLVRTGVLMTFFVFGIIICFMQPIMQLVFPDEVVDNSRVKLKTYNLKLKT